MSYLMTAIFATLMGFLLSGSFALFIIQELFEGTTPAKH